VASRAFDVAVVVVVAVLLLAFLVLVEDLGRPHAVELPSVGGE
jgi:hypothetical protein